ncbi:MarR family transcriptional regulator [Tamlana fucoidanivorans]|uniref:MarR family transcriptional regulator n=1 Tax=Allotamlana fucoidanivorans TaxID=2583814 RepID=A0A5C4SMH3_9FLAO|nr:helix-turn-helix domain-containing protein [Tamlana fucoidanivorans]TNJ45286.1 MarR family transcriptional regulator [Tamlana fucoidanivorans]
MSIFNPYTQEEDISSKIVAGLERISEAFKVLLWEKAKTLGLSPIQIQILIFIKHHTLNFCNVSHLAKEFNLTKPTISDAVRVLIKKELINKAHSTTDSRSYSIQLSHTGHAIVKETEHYAEPLKKQLSNSDAYSLEQTFKILSELIFKLNKLGILTVQRTCYRCRYYQKNKDQHYCNLLEKQLQTVEIRIDCPEFELTD